MEQHHPSTLEELLDILERTLSPEALNDLRNIRDKVALREIPSSLGLYIRTRLIHENENKEALFEDCHRESPRAIDVMRSEAHDVSQLAIVRLWERCTKD